MVGEHLLHLIPDGPLDNGRVMVPDDVLALLASVLDRLVGAEIRRKGFLIHHIPAVLLVAEDVVNAACRPDLQALHGRDMGGGELLRNVPDTPPLHEAIVDVPHDLGLLRDNHHVAVIVGGVPQERPGRAQRDAVGEAALV